jgi:YHS domain-containing protein
MEEKHTDPVCNMEVTKENAACSYEHKGKTYYFCAESCRDSFATQPDQFLKHSH